MIDNAFLDERITWVKSVIVQYEQGILDVAANNVASYQIDTGQTRQIVTRNNLTETRKTLEGYYSLLADLCNRRYGSGVVVARPAV